MFSKLQTISKERKNRFPSHEGKVLLFLSHKILKTGFFFRSKQSPAATTTNAMPQCFVSLIVEKVSGQEVLAILRYVSFT